MTTKLSAQVLETICSAARKLTGIARRAFQAEVCRDYCNGSARIAERTFGWSRVAVQKGLDEQETGTIIVDALRTGRNSYSKILPNLQDDIRSLVDPNTCTHPTFENTFRYTRMTGKAVIKALRHHYLLTSLHCRDIIIIRRFFILRTDSNGFTHQLLRADVTLCPAGG